MDLFHEPEDLYNDDELLSKMDDSDILTVEGLRGHPIVARNGFFYTKYGFATKNGLQSWICRKQPNCICKMQCDLNKKFICLINHHNHQPETSAFALAKMTFLIKTLALKDLMRSSDSIYQAVWKVYPEDLEKFGYVRVQEYVNRVRDPENIEKFADKQERPVEKPKFPRRKRKHQEIVEPEHVVVKEQGDSSSAIVEEYLDETDNETRVMIKVEQPDETQQMMNEDVETKNRKNPPTMSKAELKKEKLNWIVGVRNSQQVEYKNNLFYKFGIVSTITGNQTWICKSTGCQAKIVTNSSKKLVGLKGTHENHLKVPDEDIMMSRIRHKIRELAIRSFEEDFTSIAKKVCLEFGIALLEDETSTLPKICSREYIRSYTGHCRLKAKMESKANWKNKKTMSRVQYWKTGEVKEDYYHPHLHGCCDNCYGSDDSENEDDDVSQSEDETEAPIEWLSPQLQFGYKGYIYSFNKNRKKKITVFKCRDENCNRKLTLENDRVVKKQGMHFHKPCPLEIRVERAKLHMKELQKLHPDKQMSEIKEETIQLFRGVERWI